MYHARLANRCRWSMPLIAAVLFVLTSSQWGTAMENHADRPAIPITRVVLFSSGVGFFERTGTVEGNSEVEFRFRADDVNDLLKSLVVQDFDGGQVSAVGYASKDPVSKTLRSFAIDLTEELSLGELLSQLRGQRVELEAPSRIEGAILGVETVTQKVDDTVLEKQVLNLVTDQGLRAVPLEGVSQIRLLDEQLDGELRRALAVLAGSHDMTKKPVTISFRGEGTRRVRVGYVQESPIWKTSYRLVLDEEQAALLQGWAIVENTSEEDWTNVELTLVSGRPISFVMNLYDPLYVPRPEEQLELYASLRAQVYEQDLAEKQAAGVETRRASADPAAPPRAAVARRMLNFEASAALGAGFGGSAEERAARLDREALAQSVRSSAQAGELGELFQYRIAVPVTIQRQQSAMLPIVAAHVECKKVSIYNESVHAKHPLAGLRLTNSTELHLMQGPITVFDGGAYAGDAKIADIAPGEVRLVSYAIDLQTEVASEAKSHPEQLLNVRLVKGTMITTRKLARSRQYTVKNSGGKPKEVLIEYLLDANWKLVAPAEPAEKTRSHYRFVVQAEPKKPAVLEVKEEQMQSQQLALSNLNDQMIAFYISSPVVSEAAKEALRQIVRRKQEIAAVETQRGNLEQQIGSIAEDQARIRQNMEQLDRTSDLYKTYVKKFTDQETQIEALRGQIAELQQKRDQLQKALDEYLMGLDIP